MACPLAERGKPPPLRMCVFFFDGLASSSRVGKWRGGVGRPCVLPALSVTGARISVRASFPPPAHRTGRADFPHPALGQELMRSPTASGVPAHAARPSRAARADTDGESVHHPVHAKK